MMLVAHGIPIEVRIAQRAGARARATVAIRIGGAFIFGAILNLLYSFGGLLQEPCVIRFTSERIADPTWGVLQRSK